MFYLFIIKAFGDSIKSKIHDKDLVICKKIMDLKNADIVSCQLMEKLKLKFLNPIYPLIVVQEGYQL